MTSCRWSNSVFSVLRNLRRAGVLKNRSRTSTEVPTGCAAGCTRGDMSRPSVSTCQAWSASRVREVRVRRATELIDASASPRKPRLITRSRSSRSRILLVACRARDNGRSSAAIPLPSSRTRSSLTPPCSTSTSMRRAPESRLFSSSSLITEAGRSTTSPAAIWLASRGLSSSMRAPLLMAGQPAWWPVRRGSGQPSAHRFSGRWCCAGWPR